MVTPSVPLPQTVGPAGILEVFTPSPSLLDLDERGKKAGQVLQHLAGILQGQLPVGALLKDPPRLLEQLVRKAATVPQGMSIEVVDTLIVRSTRRHRAIGVIFTPPSLSDRMTSILKSMACLHFLLSSETSWPPMSKVFGERWRYVIDQGHIRDSEAFVFWRSLDRDPSIPRRCRNREKTKVSEG